MSSVEVATLHPVPSIFNTPDTSDTPNNAYLKRNIGEVLARAVKDVLEARPEDPIEYLAHWLYQYRDCELYFYEKATFERELQLMALRLKKLQADREARLKQLKKNLRQLGDKIRREGWEGKGLFAGLGKGKGKRKGEWSSSDESDSDVFGDDDEDADGTGRKGKKGKRDRYASLENDPEWQFLSEEEKARRRALKDKEYEEERARAKRERQMGGRFTMDEFGNKVWVETIRRGRWSVDEFGNRVFIEGRKGRRGSGYDSYDDLGRRKRKGTYALKESYSAPIPPPDDERIYNSIFILPNISHSRWVQEIKKIDEFYPKRRSEVAKRFSQEDKRLSRISHIEGSTLSVASTDTTFTSVTMAATPRQSLALSSHKRSSLSEAAKAAKLARYEREFYAGIRSHAFSPVYARWFVTDPRRLCCRHPVLGRLHYPLPRVVTEPERASTWEEKHHNPQVLYDPEVYVVENPHYDDDVYRDALVLWSEDNQSF